MRIHHHIPRETLLASAPAGTIGHATQRYLDGLGARGIASYSTTLSHELMHGILAGDEYDCTGEEIVDLYELVLTKSAEARRVLIASLRQGFWQTDAGNALYGDFLERRQSLLQQVNKAPYPGIGQEEILAHIRCALGMATHIEKTYQGVGFNQMAPAQQVRIAAAEILSFRQRARLIHENFAEERSLDHTNLYQLSKERMAALATANQLLEATSHGRL